MSNNSAMTDTWLLADTDRHSADAKLRSGSETRKVRSSDHSQDTVQAHPKL